MFVVSVSIVLLSLFGFTLAERPGCFVYQKDILVTDSSQMTGDLQLVIDTASLVAMGKMNADCSDCRFRHGFSGEWLTHWHESKCNDTGTRIWLESVSFPVTTVTIEMFYHCVDDLTWEETSVPADYGTVLSWGGEFFVPYAASTCPNGWTDTVGSDGSDRFLFLQNSLERKQVLDGSYFGHEHICSDNTEVADLAWPDLVKAPGGYVVSDSPVSHVHSLSTVDVTPPESSNDEIPLHKSNVIFSPGLNKISDILFCSNQYLSLEENSVFVLGPSTSTYASASLSSNFREFTELDGCLMRGSQQWDDILRGAPSHHHTLSGDTGTTPSNYLWRAPTSPTDTFADSPHHHQVFTTPTSDNPSNLPDHWNVVFALVTDSAGADVYTNDFVVFVTSPPPLGFVDDPNLNDVYLVGAASRGTVMISKQHSHFVAPTLTSSISSVQPTPNTGSETLVDFNHLHSAWWSVDNEIDANDLPRVAIRAMTYVSTYSRDSIDYVGVSEITIRTQVNCSGYFYDDEEVCNHGNGTCLKAGICLCSGGWIGSDCDIPVCSNCNDERGRCIAPDTCECFGNYVHRNGICDDYQCEDGNWNSEITCGGHGNCAYDDSQCVCQANYDHHSSFCDDFKCEDGLWQDQNACGDHGSCASSNPRCACEDSYTSQDGICDQVCLSSTLAGGAGLGAGEVTGIVVSSLLSVSIVVAAIAAVVVVAVCCSARRRGRKEAFPKSVEMDEMMDPKPDKPEEAAGGLTVAEEAPDALEDTSLAEG